MRIEMGRNELKIVPENDMDKAYIEDTLGVEIADTGEVKGAILERQNCSGFEATHPLAYLRIRKR